MLKFSINATQDYLLYIKIIFAYSGPTKIKKPEHLHSRMASIIPLQTIVKHCAIAVTYKFNYTMIIATSVKVSNKYYDLRSPGKTKI